MYHFTGLTQICILGFKSCSFGRLGLSWEPAPALQHRLMNTCQIYLVSGASSWVLHFIGGLGSWKGGWEGQLQPSIPSVCTGNSSTMALQEQKWLWYWPDGATWAGRWWRCQVLTTAPTGRGQETLMALPGLGSGFPFQQSISRCIVHRNNILVQPRRADSSQ